MSSKKTIPKNTKNPTTMRSKKTQCSGKSKKSVKNSEKALTSGSGKIPSSESEAHANAKSGKMRSFQKVASAAKMQDEEPTESLETQFPLYAKYLMPKTKHEIDDSELTIDLWRSDFWLRNAKLLDDRRLNMTDTGLLWTQGGKTDLYYDEWYDYLCQLCELKGMDFEFASSCLINCGDPMNAQVVVPQYRDYFLTWKSKSKCII